ncbi:phosphatase PAP2 family protein [Marinobacterium lutimaris]|uniref:PAP2 superfamily protein n=1 Tax=Marinobacterium lutimaris TaxID=568106 RepID=A0A1H6CZF1_9GAMM|nr:phosphatase PAP2 family protein [Marinobacterium lutimaris]SEG78093.1 PAP2 superfamily protein [Marinobacterium lutimaris]
MITPKTVFSTGWNWPALIVGHLISALALISYVLPGGYNLWQDAGARVFYLLNSTLADNGAWTWFWAWMNTRELDLLTGLLMICFLVFPLAIRKEKLQPAFCGFLTLMIIMLPARALLNQVTVHYGLSGDSPSLALSPSFLFSELRPSIPAKDHASSSFPGDHASVLLIWFGFLLWHTRRKVTALLISLLTLLLILPRLIGGAHWLADVAVGGLAMALTTLSWAFASPLAHRINLLVLSLFAPLFRLCGKLPLLGRLAFFNATR